MTDFNYDSVNQISAFLNDRGLGLKKRWGQNFLVNRGAREKLVGLLEIQSGDVVWEIGPGMGAMTHLILQQPVTLTAFEIDRGMMSFLEELYGHNSALRLIQGDVLKTWPAALAAGGAPPTKILGNLPYASASIIIASFVEKKLSPARMVFTVQKELALRMTAKPGQKNYSSFSVFCQYGFSISMAGDLLPGSFFPVPEVCSTIITLVPARWDNPPADEKLFFKLVRAAFHARRKTLRNNLLAGDWAAGYNKETILSALAQSGLDQNIRGERLTLADFFRLTASIMKLHREDQNG